MRKILGVLFVIDGLIGPILLFAGWYAWSGMELAISTKWDSFVSSADQTAENAAPTKKVASNGTTESAESLERESH